ncbi:13544_t:CDS:2 [Gigaspora margarita]|uniref:13544_t:CDS:1 n=1 Tax=Gigaspora margarita TaxID=4874 RepID=A0ABM8W001_GIGMA|nr:13544_t:CDS:2 [Gigaspora margarita]
MVKKAVPKMMEIANNFLNQLDERIAELYEKADPDEQRVFKENLKKYFSNKKPLNNQQPQKETEEKEKTPYQLYLEEKNEREKLQETLQGKDKEYQLGLINLNKEIKSDYKEAIERRQNTEEGVIVNSLYEYLDKRAKEGEHLKKQNLFHI